QVLDLEKLAEHRGSVLGAIPDQTQPSQKRFETLLWQKLQSFDSSKPVFVEAESRKIGSVALPVTFAAAMQNKGQLITVETPFSSRVKLLIDGYQHFLADPAAIKLLLEHLLSLRGRETINRWRNLADQGEWKTLVEELLEQHYDPSYLRSAKMRAGHYAAAQTIELDNLETNTLANAAKQLMAIGT
ncbi:MAG: hypothetical protein ACREO2_04765, partial [Arenimonas sp.]